MLTSSALLLLALLARGVVLGFPGIEESENNDVTDYKPPNRIVSAELVCTERDLQLHVLLQRPLIQPVRVFVKDQSANPHCVHLYESNATHNALMFRVPLSTCGMQRIQTHSNRFSFATSVVVSFHRFFVGSHDRAFRITCDYAISMPPPHQDVTAGVGVSEDDEKDVERVFPEGPVCGYQLLVAANATLVAAKTVRVGDELEHRWHCDDMAPGQFLFIHDCYVNPEFTLDEDPLLVDSNGCTVDAAGIGQIQYASNGRSAKSRHLAYKFADHPNVLFKCTVSICEEDSCTFTDGSPVSLPLNCSSPRRAPRSIDQSAAPSLPHPSVELSEVVQVEEVSLASSRLENNRQEDNTTASSSIRSGLCFESAVHTALLVVSVGLLVAAALVACLSRRSRASGCQAA